MKTKQQILLVILIILAIIVILALKLFYHNSNIVDINNQNNKSIDTLSEEQLKVLDSVSTDNTTTFKDVLIPDGKSMFEWTCENDLEFTKNNKPDYYLECIEAGYKDN